MNMISEHIITQLREISIVDISNFFNIQLQGDCPTGHESKNHKCFSINIHQNFFHCFSCLASGDTIRLVEIIKKVDFIDACRFLIENFKPELHENFINCLNSNKFKSADKERKYKDRELAFQILFECLTYFSNELLNNADNKKYLDYLFARGLTLDTIRNEMIGCVTNISTLIQQLKEKGYTTEQICFTGLCYLNKNSIDFYHTHDKLIFPYWNNNRAEYFIVRTLEDTTGGNRFKKCLTADKKDEKNNVKYPHSKMKNILYGLDTLKQAVKENFLIITEGIIDSILIKQLQLPVLSPITKELSKNDLEKIITATKNIDNIYIINDSEVNKQGEKGSINTAKKILNASGKEMKICRLPLPEGKEKYDLADFISAGNTKEDVLNLCNTGLNLINYLILKIDNFLELKKQLKDLGLISLLNFIKDDPARVKAYKNLLADYTGLTYEEINSYFNSSVENSGKETAKDITAKVKQFLNDRYEFRFNSVTYKPEIKNLSTGIIEEISDYTIASLFFQLEEHDFSFSKRKLETLLQDLNFVKEYDPFQEYVKNLKQPEDVEKDYIKEYTDIFTLKQESERRDFEICFRKWFVSILTAIYNTEFCNHCIFVLVGEQGIYKTTILNRLIPEQLKTYLKMGLPTKDKDGKIALATKLLINIDELESLQKTDIDYLKSLITAKTFNERLPYQHFDMQLKKRASLMASTNEINFLRDMTGNRRFLPFEIESINVHKEFNIDNMYWQANQLFQQGFEYWLNEKQVKSLNARNSKFEVENIAEYFLLQYFRPNPFEGDNADLRSTSAIIHHINTMTDFKYSNQLNTKKIGMLLRKNRFTRTMDRDHLYKYNVREVDPYTNNMKKKEQINLDDSGEIIPF